MQKRHVLGRERDGEGEANKPLLSRKLLNLYGIIIWHLLFFYTGVRQSKRVQNAFV